MKRKQFKRCRLVAAVLAAMLLMSMAPAAFAETFSAIVTSETMTVYQDAKLSKAAGTLERGEIVRITAYSGRAAKITWAGRTGYAKVADMKSVDSVAAKGVTNAGAKVYDEPGDDANTVTLEAGTHVYVLTHKGDWALVERDGELGYMKVSDLTKANDDWTTGAPAPTPTPTPTAAEKGTVTAKTLPVYRNASTNSRKLGTLKQGQVVDVLRWNAKWAYVELDGKKGYCAVKGLAKGEQASATAAPASTGSYRVSVSKLPVYKSADRSAQKLGTLKKGQAVTLISKDGDWAYIELNGNRGYCAAAGLTDGTSVDVTIAPTPTPSIENAAAGTVTVSGLTAYKTASTKGVKAFSLSKGDKVNVLKYNRDWAFIEYNGQYGFCAVAGLSRTEVNTSANPSATAAPSLNTAAQATVNQEGAPVYKTASTSAEILGTLMWGDTVNVISVSDTWAYIEKSGRYGFCRSSALTKAAAGTVETPADYVKAGFYATVIYPGAKLYESASTDAASASAGLGATLSVAAYSKDLEWACVTNGSKRAFIPIKYLNRKSYPTVTGSGTAAQTLLKALMSLGYYDGKASDAVSGEMAAAAVRRFQAACGLPETGIADETVQRILYGGYAPASDMLTMSQSLGSKGTNTSRLQTRLYVLGYLTRTASLDGTYGNTTAVAVYLFQQANGLNATGVADASTLKAMYATGANSRPSSVKAADDGTTVVVPGSSDGSVVTPPSKVTLASTYETTMPAALKSTVSTYSASMSNPQKLEHVIYSAQEKLTKPYVYGATGPNSFDCSGLSQYSFKQVEVSLKRSAYSQGYDTTYDKVEGVDNLKRGDLVFFNTISDSDLCDHVGIYLGGGCFIHASSGGHKVVVSNLTTGYYNRVFSWGRRILK